MEAAKISMPGQIKSADSNICATDLELASKESDSTSHGLFLVYCFPFSQYKMSLFTDTTPQSTSASSSFGLSTLPETEPVSEGASFTEPASPPSRKVHPFVWRINLSNTEKYWSEWFENLSNIFLSSKGGAKMLLLAGVDRLDGPMTIGQMQGKFQMQILPKVGHTIHEDDPDSVAQVVAAYLVRNRFSVSKTEFEHPFPSC